MSNRLKEFSEKLDLGVTVKNVAPIFIQELVHRNEFDERDLISMYV